MDQPIHEDLKDNLEPSDLKVDRNCHITSPQVIEHCKNHLDQLKAFTADWPAYELHNRPGIILHMQEGSVTPEEAFKELYADTTFMFLASKFLDLYEEVLVWNKNGITPSIRHREADIATFHEFGEYARTHGHYVTYYFLCRAIYKYAHRNDNPSNT